MLLSRRQAVGVSEVERQAAALVPGGTSAALGWGLVTEAALKGSERGPVGRHVKIEAESVFSAPLLLEVSQAQCLLSHSADAPIPKERGGKRRWGRNPKSLRAACPTAPVRTQAALRARVYQRACLCTACPHVTSSIGLGTAVKRRTRPVLP